MHHHNRGTLVFFSEKAFEARKHTELNAYRPMWVLENQDDKYRVVNLDGETFLLEMDEISLEPPRVREYISEDDELQ